MSSNTDRLSQPAESPQGSAENSRAFTNTSKTFPQGQGALIYLATAAEDAEPFRMVVLYTDITGICGHVSRTDSPTGNSPVRLFPWAVVESVLRVPRNQGR